ncbi:hypothetical protein AH90_19940 [Salmonella enterica subsp. enterica serovar Tennessee]|nr:hypothetical protein AH90_19940 [Salmonella enterica subsp. enterica serovar Tennessee]KWR49069.1 hypothetical protein Y094_05320 [Salmonella enterica subsp. enterica serovar Tennessee]
MVKHHVFFEENHCVARVSAREWLPDDDVTWLRFASRYLAEAVERHVVQIKIFTTQPPPISAFEVRQVDSAKMIRVPEKGIAVHDAMFEPAAQQEWDGPEFHNHTIASQPPRKPTGYLCIAVCS